jgi:hypothetical protein
MPGIASSQSARVASRATWTNTPTAGIKKATKVIATTPYKIVSCMVRLGAEGYVNGGEKFPRIVGQKFPTLF